MLHFSRWKQAAILLTCLLGLLVVLPNFLPQQTLSRWPGWLPKRQLALGLDLQGGAHLLYALEVDDVRRDWLDALRDDARQRLIEAKIPGWEHYSSVHRCNRADADWHPTFSAAKMVRSCARLRGWR